MTKPFAVFDIDGTLIRWQLYHAIVHEMGKKGYISAETHRNLHEKRMLWKVRTHPHAFSDYEKHLIQAHNLGLSSISKDQYIEVIHVVIEQYKDQTFTYTRNLIEELKSKGYILFAISGSHHEAVQQIAQYYGFDAFVGREYFFEAGKFIKEGRMVVDRKQEFLMQLIKKHGADTKKSIAIGDSASDIPMLEIVEQPIAFNPDRELFKVANEKGWKIVIERKNMVYELENRDDEYILAKTNA